MPKWEYARLDVTLYDEGSGAGRQELLYVTMPGEGRKHVTHAYGSLGFLNELGVGGWELIGIEPGLFYLKRPRR